MIRVSVDAPSAILRAGIEGLLRRSADIEIVETNPDVAVVLLDSLEDAAAAPSVLLVDDAPSGWIANALRNGARAVLPSDCSAEELMAAIHAAAAGLVALHPRDLGALAVSEVRAQRPIEELTPRETEILALLADGLSNKEIAARLDISDHTVKFHVASLLGKLGAATRTEAVSIGLRQGLILL